MPKENSSVGIQDVLAKLQGIVTEQRTQLETIAAKNAVLQLACERARRILRGVKDGEDMSMQIDLYLSDYYANGGVPGYAGRGEGGDAGVRSDEGSHPESG